MPPRAAKIVPVILPILLASAAFASESSLSTDSCLAAPKGAAPEGSHWYYRIDRTTKRHCWHLGDAQPKSPPQKSSDAAVAESAPAEQSRIAPAVADARAELVFSKPEAIVSSAAVTELQQVASASPEALPAAGSPVSLRWPEATSPNAPLQSALTSSATKTTSSETRVIPLVVADARSDTHAISIPLLFAAIAGAMGTAGLFGAVIHRFGRARREGRQRRIVWEQLPASALNGVASTPTSAGTNAPDQRIAQMMARLSRSAAIS
jgi:hypothetical protein